MGVYIYILWAVICVVMLGIGICAWMSKKPVRFWTIAQEIQIKDVKRYNQAVAKLWFVYAAGLAVLGLPLMSGQNSGWIVITILGAVFWSIVLMAAYIRIEKKYRIL